MEARSPMSPIAHLTPKSDHRGGSLFPTLQSILCILIGAFIAAFSINIFFVPNNLFDGGTVGLAMIVSRIIGLQYLAILIALFTIPFVILAYKFLGQSFVLHFLVAAGSFSLMVALMPHLFPTPFMGETLEVVVIGGAILGIGLGIIIRYGGCIDGTEILGLIINKRYGFTVGQIVFGCNIIVFSLAGLIFQDWHPPLLSLIAFIVVAKIMDFVIVGLDETKAVLVISNKYQEISDAIMHDLGIGLTILYGRRGFSNEPIELLYVITERLQLAELKDLVYSIDPKAFLAIENLHEVSSGKQGAKAFRKKENVHTLALKTILNK